MDISEMTNSYTQALGARDNADRPCFAEMWSKLVSTREWTTAKDFQAIDDDGTKNRGGQVLEKGLSLKS